MRLLLAASLALAAGAASAAEAARKPVAIAAPRDRRSQIDCPRPVIEHAQAGGKSGPNRLADQPPAYRLHTVNRTVAGCAVYPEAQKVSDTTGKLAVPPPRKR